MFIVTRIVNFQHIQLYHCIVLGNLETVTQPKTIIFKQERNNHHYCFAIANPTLGLDIPVSIKVKWENEINLERLKTKVSSISHSLNDNYVHDS